MKQEAVSRASSRPDRFAHAFVATDFTEGAAHALARAAQLPLAPKGQISVVHVLSDRIPQRVRSDEEKVAQVRLEQASKAVRRAYRVAERATQTVEITARSGPTTCGTLRRPGIFNAISA